MMLNECSIYVSTICPKCLIYPGKWPLDDGETDDNLVKLGYPSTRMAALFKALVPTD